MAQGVSFTLSASYKRNMSPLQKIEFPTISANCLSLAIFLLIFFSFFFQVNARFKAINIFLFVLYPSDKAPLSLRHSLDRILVSPIYQDKTRSHRKRIHITATKNMVSDSFSLKKKFALRTFCYSLISFSSQFKSWCHSTTSVISRISAFSILLSSEVFCYSPSTFIREFLSIKIQSLPASFFTIIYES